MILKHHFFPFLLTSLIAVFCLSTPVSGADFDLAPLEQWMATSAQTQSLEADLQQTREMKTFNRPLTSEGKFYFRDPSQYRWEIETPQPKSAILTPEKVAIIYPQMKRMEIIELGSIEKSSWRETLELIRAGFPRSLGELEQHFRIVGLAPAENREGAYMLQLHLRSKRSSNPVREVQVLFRPSQPAPLLTALIFEDESRVISQFTNVKVNPQLPETTFSTEPPADYTVTNPLD